MENSEEVDRERARDREQYLVLCHEVGGALCFFNEGIDFCLRAKRGLDGGGPQTDLVHVVLELLCESLKLLSADNKLAMLLLNNTLRLL